MSNQQRFSGEWETKRLGELVSIRNQKVMPENVNPNTSCVELEHIASGIGRLLENSTAEYSTASKYRFFAGDVLFGRLRSYLRKFWLADHDGICTTEIWPLMVDAKQIDSTFLHAIVQTDEFFAMANLSYGTHMPRTDWTVMRNFSILLPPIQEQRAIAEVLSDVDGLINALDALIAKKRAIKQATMQQLLTGKTRLPGFSGEWETKRLGEISDINPQNFSSNTDPDYKFNYVTLEQVESGKLLGYSEEVFHTAPSRAQRILRNGDVLMSTVRPNLMAHLFFQEQVSNAVCSTGFAVLRAKQDLSVPYFLFSQLFSDGVNDQIDKILSGSNYPAINSSDVKLIEIPCPPHVKEQRTIATVLSDMDAEIAALEHRRDKTISIKQGMMQQLLTGKVRLLK